VIGQRDVDRLPPGRPCPCKADGLFHTKKRGYKASRIFAGAKIVKESLENNVLVTPELADRRALVWEFFWRRLRSTHFWPDEAYCRNSFEKGIS